MPTTGKCYYVAAYPVTSRFQTRILAVNISISRTPREPMVFRTYILEHAERLEDTYGRTEMMPEGKDER